MIPSLYRLKLSRNHRFIGDVVGGRYATHIIKAADSPQWAVQVSKRIDRRAVVRNRLRRQINGWLYKHRDLVAHRQLLIILKTNPQQNLDDFFQELSRILKLRS